MQKNFIVIFSIIIIIIFKMVINRKLFYIRPNHSEKPYKNFLNIKNISEFKINSTLTWYIPSRYKSNKIIIFCHSNFNNITWKTKILNNLSNHFNCPIICQDYLRIKNPSVEKMKLCTENLIKFLFKKGYSQDSIILFGESFGSAIALEVGKKYNIKNIICYNAFRKISDLFKNIFRYIVSFFTSELNNEKIINTSMLNLTFLNSKDDRLINYLDIKKMCMENQIEFLKIYGSHNNSIIPYEVFLRLKQKYKI